MIVVARNAESVTSIVDADIVVARIVDVVAARIVDVSMCCC